MPARDQFLKLKQLQLLPSPQGAALKLVQLCQRDPSLDDLQSATRLDPVFAAKLVSAANLRVRTSGANGGRPVASLNVAIQMLGLLTVRRLALSFSLVGQYDEGLCQAFPYKAFWSKSLMSGVALQDLGVRLKTIQPDEGFCLGLLATIGELGLATVFPEKYSQVLTRRHEFRGFTLPELEAKALGISSLELTSEMLREWGFPQVLYDACQFADRPALSGFVADSRELRLCSAVHLAKLIGAYCLLRDEERPAFVGKILDAGKDLNLTEQDLVEVCRACVTNWKMVGGDMMVYTCEVPSLDAVIQRQKELTTSITGLDASDTQIFLQGLIPENIDADVQPASGFRILIVDDDASTRMLTKVILEKEGHHVFEADNGQDGFRMALECQPHLLVIDWVMPGMDGVTLTRQLRETTIGESAYILLLTGKDDDESIVEAFKAGADDYMTKPIRQQVLLARLIAAWRVIRLQGKNKEDNQALSKAAADLAAANRRLTVTSLTCSLTGIPNRRYYDQRCAQGWSAATRSGIPLSILQIDVDNFKQINDRYGHAGGDVVLKVLAQTMRQSLRQSDILARTGGDEFSVVSLGASVADAVKSAVRLCQSMQSTPISVSPDLPPFFASLSVGVAERDPKMKTVDDLLQLTDKSLYVVKETGRNGVAAIQIKPTRIL